MKQCDTVPTKDVTPDFSRGVCLKSQTFPSENQELALGRDGDTNNFNPEPSAGQEDTRVQLRTISGAGQIRKKHSRKTQVP